VFLIVTPVDDLLCCTPQSTSYGVLAGIDVTARGLDILNVQVCLKAAFGVRVICVAIGSLWASCCLTSSAAAAGLCRAAACQIVVHHQLPASADTCIGFNVWAAPVSVPAVLLNCAMLLLARLWTGCMFDPSGQSLP
jgi:hypothetical protein